jgi:hypothetical protein
VEAYALAAIVGMADVVLVIGLLRLARLRRLERRRALDAPEALSPERRARIEQFVSRTQGRVE